MQVSQGSRSLFKIADQLKLTNEFQICQVNVGGTLVSETHDPHQVQQIYMDKLVSVQLYLIIINLPLNYS